MIPVILGCVCSGFIFFWIGISVGTSGSPSFPLPDLSIPDFDLRRRVSDLEMKTSNDYYRKHDDIMRISHLLQYDIKKQMNKLEENDLKVGLLAEQVGFEWKETIGSGWIKTKK